MRMVQNLKQFSHDSGERFESLDSMSILWVGEFGSCYVKTSCRSLMKIGENILWKVLLF